MSQRKQSPPVVEFYETHPINEDQILKTLRSKGISTESLTEETLKDYDQDHYGGVEAVDTLARKVGIQPCHYVLDVCSGMGGPARYLAHRYGCRVTGLDITESRYRGSLRLTQLVKLEHLVDFRLGSALDMPFAADTFDVVIGQEAWLHVPDKERLVAECSRVVKAGGVIAFTDVLRRGALSPAEWDELQRAMAVATLETLEGYSRLLAQAGCAIREREDLGDHWAEILTQRLEMYRSLKEETVRKFGVAHYRKWDDVYSFYVKLFREKKLGGARFIAQLDGSKGKKAV
jgi:ubiquinone/menaquinone biosynthesis C-methylase UbiE